MSGDGSEFDAAVNCITSLRGHPPPQDVILQFYGRYKHATEGPCNTAAPPFFEVVARAKHSAWLSHRHKSTDAVKREYVALLDSLVPDWRDEGNVITSSSTSNPEDAPNTAAEAQMQHCGVSDVEQPLPTADQGATAMTTSPAPATPSSQISVQQPQSTPLSIPSLPTAAVTAGTNAAAPERTPHPAAAPVLLQSPALAATAPGRGTVSRLASTMYADFTAMSESFSVSVLATPMSAIARLLGGTTARDDAPRSRNSTGGGLEADDAVRHHTDFVSPATPEGGAAGAGASGQRHSIRWSYSPNGPAATAAAASLSPALTHTPLDAAAGDARAPLDPALASSLHRVAGALAASQSEEELRRMASLLSQRIEFQRRVLAGGQRVLEDLTLNLQATREALGKAWGGRAAGDAPPSSAPGGEEGGRDGSVASRLATAGRTALAYLWSGEAGQLRRQSRLRSLARCLVALLLVVLLLSSSRSGRGRVAAVAARLLKWRALLQDV